MVELLDKLKELQGQEVFINMIGGGFSPKGILNEVKDDFIVVGDRIIPMTSIAQFQLARRNGD